MLYLMQRHTRRQSSVNVLSDIKKKMILQCLVEGNSIRSTERITGVHRDTILRLLIQVSKICKSLSDNILKNLSLSLVQADEIWCFVKKKDKRIKAGEKNKKNIGSQYLYIAMCANTKLVISYMIGKRTVKTTRLFINDFKSRLNSDSKIQLTTDGFQEYNNTVENAFGADIDYAQTIKHQGYINQVTGEYIPPFKNEYILQGDPDKKKISTSFVERQNLTVRMCLRRFTRLTNGFSKKFENLKAALNLHFFYYNFMRIHQSLQVTPAMEAEISNHIWTWDEIICSTKIA